ncbi:TPA: hypothetical protein ACF3SB_003025 [Klebsiella quasipneumoniae subsp. quasipneumoniae]
MTTDITELAQSLKRRATSANEFGESLYVKADEVLALVEALASEKRICATWRKTAKSTGEKLEKSEKTSEARREAIDRAHNMFVRERDRANAAEEALEKAQATEAHCNRGWIEAHEQEARAEAAEQRIAELESRTVKLPDGWQFEECEMEGCENGAIFSVGTGGRNIHLCDKCARESQNSRLKKSPLPKRLPFKMSAGIKVEVE